LALDDNHEVPEELSCSQPENRGWACGGSEEISLKELPPSAGIDVILEVSELASSSELEFKLGDSKLAGILPPGTIALTLDFNNSAPSNSLEIKTPINELNSGSTINRFIRVVYVIVVR
jgi:hypothetical protein